MNTSLTKQIPKYALFVLLLKIILFVIGTFIKNQTMPMAILTMAYLSSFCIISIIMIKNYRSITKLKLKEKLTAITLLFILHEIWGILLHSVYFIGILGQEPTAQEFVNKVIGIVKFDSHIFIIAAIISVFINAKVKTIEPAK